jgi:hypothetical protein
MKMKQLYDWLCQAARRKGIETLLYWPQFFRWIKERYTDKGILDAEWRPSELALEFLADDYGASFETVRRIIRCSTGEI